jgi:alpha-1,2-mannosyltransferase
MRIRLSLVAANLAALTFSLLTFSRRGVGFYPYRLDLDVYRIGSLTFLHGGSLYHGLLATSPGVALPFTYPPFAAVLLSPLAMLPMAAASMVVTLAGVALTGITLRGFTRALSSAPRLSLWWLLPAALFLEPVHSTLEYGQVEIALLAAVSLDCLHPNPRWPRGALTGLAAAVKLTPAAFVLFFLLRRDRRAAATAAGSFAVATGSAFALDWHDSVRYWTHVVFDTGRPGNPAFAANQSISGLLARAGLDPRTHAGTLAWLTLSAAVLAVAVIGIRRALAAAEPAWALSLNAFAGLLVSPISWTHHWVWAEPALVVLAILSTRHSRRAGLAVAVAGVAVFAVPPTLPPPSGHGAWPGWIPWEQAAGSSYVIFAVGVLLLSAFAGRANSPAALPAGVLEGGDPPAAAVLGQHEGLHGFVVGAGGALLGERHGPRGHHDRHIWADESGRPGLQDHAGAGQGTSEEGPMPVLDGPPAAPPCPVPGDEVGVVGE